MKNLGMIPDQTKVPKKYTKSLKMRIPDHLQHFRTIFCTNVSFKKRCSYRPTCPRTKIKHYKGLIVLLNSGSERHLIKSWILISLKDIQSLGNHWTSLRHFKSSLLILRNNKQRIVGKLKILRTTSHQLKS